MEIVQPMGKLRPEKGPGSQAGYTCHWVSVKSSSDTREELRGVPAPCTHLADTSCY